jgi:hypothetical protein
LGHFESSNENRIGDISNVKSLRECRNGDSDFSDDESEKSSVVYDEVNTLELLLLICSASVMDDNEECCMPPSSSGGRGGSA